MATMILPPFQGADGRLYFNFGVGDVMAMRDRYGNEYTFEIVGCEYLNGREYYTATRDGNPLWGRLSANRLHFLFYTEQLYVVKYGERKELPLTNEEVTTFIGIENRQESKRISELKAKLKETDYTKLVKELNSNGISQIFAQRRAEESADGLQKLNALQAREQELRKQITEILKAKGVEASELKTRMCSHCKGTGFVDGEICDCITSRADLVKSVCAKARLSANNT